MKSQLFSFVSEISSDHYPSYNHIYQATTLQVSLLKGHKTRRQKLLKSLSVYVPACMSGYFFSMTELINARPSALGVPCGTHIDGHSNNFSGICKVVRASPFEILLTVR